jgi:uncharacterized protein (TIGR02996 family)
MNPEAFLRTIREHPDDDGPRLVYADWLEERGECDRAEFIRVQCELEQAPDDERYAGLAQREAELLQRHREAWFGDWQPGPHVRIRRGFLDVVVSTTLAPRLREDQFRAPGLLELGISVSALALSEVRSFLSWRGREFVTRIESDWHWDDEQWPELRRYLDADWPRLHTLRLPALQPLQADVALLERLPALRRMQLRNSYVPPGGSCWRAILDSPVIERLSAFELEGIPLSESDAREFGHEFGRASNPVELALSNCRLGSAELAEFVHSCDLRRLRRLDLTGNPLRDSGVRTLADGGLDALTDLNIGDCQCGGPGIRALMECGLLKRLTGLHLDNNFFDDSTARLLVESGALNSKTHLSLGSNLTDSAMTFLANNPTSVGWRELAIHGSSSQGSAFTSAGLMALLRSREMKSLSRLQASGVQLHLGHVTNLNRKPFASRLRELWIVPGSTDAYGPVSRQSVVNLLSSPWLPRLQRLRVSSVSPISAIPELHQRFGARFVCDTTAP